MSTRFDPIAATGAACYYCGCTEDEACELEQALPADEEEDTDEAGES